MISLHLNSFFIFYLAAWGTACLIAGGLMIRHRRELTLFGKAYRQLLFQPWKLFTFAIAGSAITLAGPYTCDPTWDYVDGAFMSLLTFFTAPWVVAILYRFVRGREPIRQLYIALCVWFFSACWSYDLYLLFRDGHYPLTWLPNILASSSMYLTAGLLWSLEWQGGRGVSFSFLQPTWPEVDCSANFAKLFWPALLLMLTVAVPLVYFFLLPQ